MNNSFLLEKIKFSHKMLRGGGVTWSQYIIEKNEEKSKSSNKGI
jgi:hypothetical protein